MPNNRPLPLQIRWLFLVSGWLCTAVGVAGIFLPLVPTVPLLLLAGFFFARSSPRWHKWLLDHPHLGPLICDFLDGSGVPMRAKVFAISGIWISLLISLYLTRPLRLFHGLGIIIVAGVTIYLLRLPLRKNEISRRG